MNNLYADWCADARRKPRRALRLQVHRQRRRRRLPRRPARRLALHFVATTVDLLTTGVDVPCVRNIVFFKYVRSPIAFYQMVGRGTRLDPPTGKLMFRVYDYTDATRLFGEDFAQKYRAAHAQARTERRSREPPTRDARSRSRASTCACRTTRTLHRDLDVDGKAMPVTVEEYKERLAAKLVAEAPTLDAFRALGRAAGAPGDARPPARRRPFGPARASSSRTWPTTISTTCWPSSATAWHRARATDAPRRSPTSTRAGWPACPSNGRRDPQALALQFARDGTEAWRTRRSSTCPT